MMSTLNGRARHRNSAPLEAPSSDSGLLLAPALKSKRRYVQQSPNTRAKNKAMYYHGIIATMMAAFVLFQICFLHQLEKYHENETQDSESISWKASTNRQTPGRRQPGRAVAGGAAAQARKPPRPKTEPPPKTTLLPKHVVTIFGPESSGTTFLSTTLGIAVGAWAPEGKWTFIPGNQWTIPNDPHEFTEKTRWLLETSLGRRAMSPDGHWEIQHLSLPWGWYCEEDRQIEIVEALVPEECWRYQEDSHVSPKAAEAIWYGKAKRARKKLAYYMNPDNFEGVKKIPKRKPQELKYIDLCKNEVHISQENEDGGDWSCGAKCGSGAFDGFALYPKRFSVNITSHIEWYLARGVEVTAILSARDRTISTKSKLQDHCKLEIGVEEDEVALDLMTEALERYGKSGTHGEERERALVVSYEGLMGVGKAHLFDLYRKLGINSTYTPAFKDGNNKYVTLYKKMPVQRIQLDAAVAATESESRDNKIEESEHKTASEPPPKPKTYRSPPPKKNLLPKRVISVFGPESSGTTFLTSVLGVATGAFPKEGKWTQVLAPKPQESIYPENPRMKWKFEHMIPDRATTDDGSLEVQHLSLPSGWVCQKEPSLNKIHVVEAFVPSECMRYEALPELDLRLAEQIWYNKHAPKPKKPATLTDTVEDFDWDEEQQSRNELEKLYLKQCRNQVNISHQLGSCGAQCGKDEYNGFAMYPNRYFVNITSHIDWYLSRGVDITVVISMRDRSISRAAKHREHCRFPNVAAEEDETAMSLINDAINKYGTRGDGTERVITVSYEAMMEFGEPYLFDLYYQLGIDSDYVPEFRDGNPKYVTNATKAQLFGGMRRPGRLTSMQSAASKPLRPPSDWKPRPPKKSILPKRVITVVGPESSGTTLLSTALGVATGGFNPEGEWFQIWSFGRKKTKLPIAPSELDFNRDAVKKMDYKETVTRRVNSLDGVEIQHLSLPWGGMCNKNARINIVEALVPDECFRYERAPNMDPHFAEEYFWSEHRKEVLKRKGRDAIHRQLSESTYFNHEDIVKMAKCRNEAKISEALDEHSCGAECGTGDYDGFALYPQRFSINITSHIEWYLARDVDVTVVVITRDATISQKGKIKSHCQVSETADLENQAAYDLIEESLEKYGKRGSMLEPGDKERVIDVNYEAFMALQEAYLFDLYWKLGINSTYTPSWKDGNIKYVVDPVQINPMYHLADQKIKQFDERPPKPASLPPPPPKQNFFLPRRLISVFSLDSSRFLSTSIAVATGSFPEGGQWIEQDNTLIYEDTIKQSAKSPNGEVLIQHIVLPTSGTECESKAALVHALAPPECSLYHGNNPTPNAHIANQCKDELFIAEENGENGAKWSCGGYCGSEKYDGYALYPTRYFVNISSHIEWYLARGVDVTAVIQTRDRSVAKKSLVVDTNACHSRTIASEEEEIGLSLMKEAYKKYGQGAHNRKGRSKGAERVIVASYESLMKLKESYLLRIYEQLDINSGYISQLKSGKAKYPLNFKDDNAKYIRTPPVQKKSTTTVQRPAMSSNSGTGVLGRIMRQYQQGFFDEHDSIYEQEGGGGLFGDTVRQHQQKGSLRQQYSAFDSTLQHNSRLDTHRKSSEENFVAD